MMPPLRQFNTFKKSLITLGVVAGLVTAVPVAWSAGAGDNDYSQSESPLVTAANKLIRKDEYQKAYDRIQAGLSGDAKNADLHNLLGFTARKLGEYAQSKAHYTKALELDPKHKGALSYMGELYLALDMPEETQKLRARLDKICWLGCDALDDLDAAIKKWEASQ